MLIVRLIVLGFFAHFCYSLVIEHGSLNSFGRLVAYGSIVIVLVIYMLATIEARVRKSRNPFVIVTVNLLLEGSAALRLAFKHTFPVIAVSANDPRISEYPKRKTDCPYCGEEILVVTIQCEHCLNGLK